MFIERGSVMDELTNETKFVLQTLYKEYLDRSNNGISKIQAKEFKYAQFVYDELFSEMLYDDFYNSIMELDTQGFLDCTYGNDTATQIFLTNKSIIEMENNFSKDFNKILDSIIKLKSLIF